MPSLSSASALQVAAETVTRILAQIDGISNTDANQEVVEQLLSNVPLTRTNRRKIGSPEFASVLADIISAAGLDNVITASAAQNGASDDGIIDAQELNEILAQVDESQNLSALVNEALSQL